MMIVRLRLLQRQYEAALDAVAVLRAADNTPQMLIGLAGLFENARQDERAAKYFREALEAGHYPEALLGLARLATGEGRFDEARTHLTCALNLETKADPKGRTATDLFQPLVSQLAMLGEPRPDCKAWIVTFPGTAPPAALANCSLMVYGTTRYAIETHLNLVLDAMAPGSRPDFRRPTKMA